MKRVFKIIILTIGFFTTIPVPFIKWNEQDNKYIPLFIPLIGMIISGFLYLVIIGLQTLGLSSFMNAVVIVVFFILITGGLHLDAFMDMTDAHFSRRPIPRKLEIMKDSNIGAFAAVFFIVLILSKVAILNELYVLEKIGLSILFIPIISRLYQSLLLLNTPFAKEDSLASMYGSLQKRFQITYLIYVVVILVVANYVEVLPIVIYSLIVGLVYGLYYRRFSKKQFGGITGDIIGAYIEIVEVILLLGVLAYDFIPWW